ncbi:LLM class flavin-dependent oxidoreductase [Streptomyces sp. NPDC093252]|uniref:LLM class flavin-dependent oxidoreductase n=1 Tax=Streptomyces sp. NPDC093252 TaxID=3154980 RepID=UPI00341A782A
MGAPRLRLGFLTHVQGRDQDFARAYRDAQDLFVAADQLGFDIGWVAQHHVAPGGGGLSSPWTFLAHAAARTRRIRLGTAVTVLPLEDPVRLAEDIATVDILSGGRVEIGVGSGSGTLEYTAFGKDPDRRRRLTSDHLRVLRAALSGEEVGAPGFRIQPPPAAGLADRIWQGVFSPTGAAHAAAAGSHLLLNRAAYGHDAPTDEVQRPWADTYLAAWDRPHRPRVGLSRFVFPAEDRRTALAHIRDDVHRAALAMAGRGTLPPGPGPEEALRRFHCFYGHPEEIVTALRRERVLPVATDLITQFNPAVLDHGTALRALERIATEVAPALGWKPATAPEPTPQRPEE